ncbi:CvfB family protein [Poritiphilus flavus]|uniref:GntR family transcriptional regulator n=1 Tax=Poritiphilus flavus TaxID=2697053 RepID=A0A6L9EFF0_9FLAO|nr:S1-like domain-containing RNA-binding protein [Poritiphilus flavus]NAS13446.1 GntR family transcriptional regulator [Poritiphilus flavus]
MVEIGNYNSLSILRSTRVGLFLGDEDVDDLLLPTKYAPQDFAIGDTLEVFCYLDHEERPIATTLDPFIKRNDFGYLRVAEVNETGAFLDWGLEKHLLVPFREQPVRMEEGKWYVVFCYLDEKSFRLVASGRVEKFLSNNNLDVKQGEEVQLLVNRKTDLGWDLIVNNRHRGLVYANEVFKKLEVGDRIQGFVKQIRPDNKLDISLEPLGFDRLEPAAQMIYEQLLQADGFLGVHDKSSPEEIKSLFQMSKKTFKKAIGTLYKARKIEIRPDGIYKV